MQMFRARLRASEGVIHHLVLTTALSVVLGGTLAAQSGTPAALPLQTTPDLAAQQQEAQQRLLQDWANLARYRDDNGKLARPTGSEQRVVFIGDSITDAWGRRRGSFFPGKPYVNRGISGQTTPQILVRFRADVLALKPDAVVILAGINDVAENTGPTTLEAIEDNLMSMVDLAKANNVRVVLASITPALAFPWRPDIDPRAKIAALNAWMKDYARSHDVVYLDYYSHMAGGDGGMKPGLAVDGVHPTDAGYEAMTPLAEDAIAEALRARR